jgi:DNA-binding NarL/FixJ family response regulator
VGVRVIELTTFDLDEYVYGALRAGASGFLLKDAPPEEVHRAIREVADGGALIAPTVTRRLIAELALRPQTVTTGDLVAEQLTEREVEVLRYVARGLTNSEIAERLTLSPLTVKTHVSRMLTKLRLRDRAQLVVLACESGLVVPGSGIWQAFEHSCESGVEALESLCGTGTDSRGSPRPPCCARPAGRGGSRRS